MAYRRVHKKQRFLILTCKQFVENLIYYHKFFDNELRIKRMSMPILCRMRICAACH